MAKTPKATVTVSAEAGPIGTGTNLITIMAPVPLNADGIPRQFASAKQVFDQHGYSEGCEFAALYADEVGLPFIFCGIPIATQGVLGQVNNVMNTGTSTPSVALGTNGPLGETQGVLKVKSGGTVGTSQIVLDLSLDGGSTYRAVRLGTALTYTIPYLNLILNFTVGSLVTGDTILNWKTTQPQCDSAGITLARTNLAAGQKLSKSWLIVTDSPDLTFANAVLGQANTYETANERFIRAAVQVRDHLTPAVMSKTSITVRTTCTFAEVGATADTITRLSGSFLADGVAVGDMVAISGTASNNIAGVAKITAVTATVVTLDTDDLNPEVGVLATLVFTGSLTFTNTGDTIVRNRGSWVDDGFRASQVATVSGTGGSNDVAASAVVTVTHTTLTLSAAGVNAEQVKSSGLVTITCGETKTQWVTAIESAYATIDSAPRIGLGAGRARKVSPLTGWNFRRPVQWAEAIRSYQHDVHVAPWRKDLGNLAGWSLLDASQQLVEYDDRVDGGGLSAARFTSFRSWANGPGGAFINLALTRDVDLGLLSYTHNADVVNLAQTLTHSATENCIGRSLQLNTDGTATKDSLAAIKAEVDSRIQRELLKDIGEGNRCSQVEWTPSATDILSGAEARLTGVLELYLNGTIHSISTVIKVK